MSAQAGGARGNRAILVIARSGVTDLGNRLAAALDRIAAAGYELAGVIDPEHARDALRLVLDGAADLVVVTRAEDFPFVQFAADLDDHAGRRPRPTLRPTSAEESARTRRPQPVQPAEVVSAIADAGHVRRAELVDEARQRRPQIDRYQRTDIIRRTG